MELPRFVESPAGLLEESGLLPEIAGATPQLRPYQEEALSACLALFSPVVRVRLPCGTGSSWVIAALTQYLHGAGVVCAPTSAALQRVAQKIRKYSPLESLRVVDERGDWHTPAYFDGVQNLDVTLVTYANAGQLLARPHSYVVLYDHCCTDLPADVQALGANCEKLLYFSAMCPPPLNYEHSLGCAIQSGYLREYKTVVPSLGPGSQSQALAEVIACRSRWRNVIAYCNTRNSAYAFAEKLRSAGVRSHAECAADARRSAPNNFTRYRAVVTTYDHPGHLDADCLVLVETPRRLRVLLPLLGRFLQARDRGRAYFVLPAYGSAKLREVAKLLGLSDSRILKPPQSGGVILSCVRHKNAARVSLWKAWECLVSEQRPFAQCIELLAEYYKTHDLPPPLEYVTACGFNLGAWLEKRRYEFRMRTLPKPHIQALYDVNPNWNFRERRPFGEWIELLRGHFKKFHSLPERHHITEGGARLGRWVFQRRQNLRDGLLTPDQVDALRDACPIWDLPLKKPFEEQLRRLAEYYKTHATMPPLMSKQGYDHGLGRWAYNMRRRMLAKSLPDEQRAQLEAACPGWNWNKRKIDMRDLMSRR